MIISTTVAGAHPSDTPDELHQDRIASDWWIDLQTQQTDQGQSEADQHQFVQYVTTAPVLVGGALAELGALQHRQWSGSVSTEVIGTRTADAGRRLSRYPFTVGEAERRLDQLKAVTGTPTMFAGDGPDDEPQAPLSSTAVKRTRRVLRAAAGGFGFLPKGRVSIFPMPDGGLQLQRSGDNSSISIEIPPDPTEPILAEFASNDEYWSKELDEPADVATFLNRVLR